MSARDLEQIRTDQGESLLELSRKKPVLMVFLRHLGCTFCREALRDLSAYQKDSRGEKSEIVLVHMERAEIAESVFTNYGLAGCKHITDQQQVLYQKFGLSRGSFSQLFGFRTMVRGFQSGFSWDQLGGHQFGDAFQMPGIFVIYQGRIVSQYIHKKISDRPDYHNLIECCLS